MTETEQARPKQPAEGADEATPAPRASAVPGAGSPSGEQAPETHAATDGETPQRAGGQLSDNGDATEIEEDLDTPPAPGDGGPGAQSELAKVGAQRDEFLALAQRTQADFENYRKRVARDSAAAQERGVAKLARELLPALDNLDRALDSAAEQDPLLEGVRLVRSELAAALGRVGIESFSPAGEPFDPEQHEAIVQQPVEGAKSGTVAEVYQPGYRLNGTIIRPARVVVAA
jgi:molecular chaperone GrpE